MDAPNVVGQPRFHRGRDSEGRMNAAEVVIGEVQGNRGFQVRQLFTERIREARKTAHRHTHRKVLPFDIASRDFVGIGIANSDLGYNLRDPWWGVPRIGVFYVAEQFHKLREVHVRSEALRHTHGVVVQPVRGELHAISETVVQVPQESRCVGPESLAHVERGDQLSFRVNGDIDPLVADFGRVAFVNAGAFLVNERPDFINLQIPGGQVPHSRVHQLRAAFPGDDEQTHDRVAVESGKPLRAANRATFQKAVQRTRSRIGIRRHRVARLFVVRFAERRIAGLAAPTLNAALTEVPKLFAVVVLAFPAGHLISPLALCGETSQNTLGSKAWVTPRFGLAPTTARTAAGALSQLLRLWWRSGHGLLPAFLKRSALESQGVSHSTPKLLSLFTDGRITVSPLPLKTGFGPLGLCRDNSSCVKQTTDDRVNGCHHILVMFDRETKSLQSNPYVNGRECFGVRASEGRGNRICQTAEVRPKLHNHFLVSFRQGKESGNLIAFFVDPDIKTLAVLQQFGQLLICYFKIGFVVFIHVTRRLSHYV
jgi:hypothetical protein